MKIRNEVFKIWIDRGIRLVLGVYFAWTAGIYGQNALREIRSFHGHSFDFAILSKGLSVFAICLYSFTIACLYVLRYRSVSKFAGWRPSLAALLGGFLTMGLVLLPKRDDLPVFLQILSSFMVLTGMGLTAFVLTQLGRSFSILPESRKLVVHGAYKYIRHPLYLFESIATLGMLIHFWSIGAVALVATQFFFQIMRIHYEEQVLRKNFPEYAEYASRTARLIPGIY